MMCEASQRGDYNLANLHLKSCEMHSANYRTQLAEKKDLMDRLDKLKDKLSKLMEQKDW